MPLPAAARILDLHDALTQAGPARRALLLLEAGDGWAQSSTAAVPLGTVDAGLLGLHAGWFGPRLVAEARCPQCAASLEVSLDVAALAGAAGVPTELTVTRDDVTAVVRPITLTDLAAAEGLAPRDARAHLLRSGLASLQRGGHACDPAALPDDADSWLSDALASADPQADLLVSLACAGCDSTWEERLDVSAFLVARLASLASHLVAEVHQLATAYGWSEAAILALPAQRRRHYLELAAA